MNKLIVSLIVNIGIVMVWNPVLGSDVTQYSANPYTFSIAGSAKPYGFGDHFMVFDINNDGAKDFLYRTLDTLFVHDHYSTGTPLWNFPAQVPFLCNGSSFGVADIDRDGQAEVILLDNSSNLHVINGLTGAEERSIVLNDIGTGLGTGQKGGYLAVVNLRGTGDRDVIVQTVDETVEGDGREFYINRSLIAINMEEPLPENMQIWRVDQDRDINNSPFYEGYWGQAHGGLMCADVDSDGLDEVIGGSMIDDDGTVISLSYPESDWVGASGNNIDHLDAVEVGDYRPDQPGLEWCVSQEDWTGEIRWETVMFDTSGIIWQHETDLYADGSNDREPQNLAVGDFDDTRSYAEIWNRSRFNHDEKNGQHPWVFDNNGTQIADYDMYTKLPDNFSSEPKHGIENIWTIDWDGSGKEYIAGKARSGFGHVGIFNAVSGNSVWSTTSVPSLDTLQAKTLYVADISGDSREEIVIVDLEDHTIKVFHNDDPFTDTGPDKWDDPLYRRLKQNWSYYSPGGYTQRDPVKVKIRVFLEGPYLSGYKMDTSLKQYDAIPLQSPYIQDPRIVQSIPDSIVDWALVQLRKTADGNTIDSRSCFLKSDGYIITEDTNELNFFVDPDDYYLVVRHRNHLDVMSSSAISLSTVVSEYDFSTGTGQYEGNNAALLETGVYGMYAGDADNNGEVQNSDKNDYWKVQVGLGGYRNSDFNLNGEVQNNDKNDIWKSNVGKGTQIEN
ncbi:MAG: hypothetical protein R6V04_01560 [bacterium]